MELYVEAPLNTWIPVQHYGKGKYAQTFLQ